MKRANISQTPTTDTERTVVEAAAVIDHGGTDVVVLLKNSLK